MKRDSDVLIIGGGVIGLACAYYLRQAGRRVRLLEQGEIGAGASHGNCGLITPSFGLPLARPGALADGLRYLFRKDAPLYIKPTLDPHTLRWLLHFALRCRTKPMLAALRGRKALLESSRSLFDELFRAEAMPCDYETAGSLYVFKTEEALHHYESWQRILADEGYAGGTFIDGAALRDTEPALQDGMVGAYLNTSDAHVRPDHLLREWARVNQECDVDIIEECGVLSVRPESSQRVRVETVQGDFTAAVGVLAAGAWSPSLAQPLGVSLPIQPGKGYSITMRRPTVCPRLPLHLEEAHVVATPWASGYRLGGTMEFSGYDESIDKVRLAAIRRGAAEYLRKPEGEISEEFWQGWRPMTWDGLPIIDRAPRHENIFIVAGHNMLGLSMATATGLLTAQMITGEPPHIDPTPYRATRFG